MQTHKKEIHNIVKEQRALSIKLCQLLYDICLEIPLEFESDEPTAVSVFYTPQLETPTQKRAEKRRLKHTVPSKGDDYYEQKMERLSEDESERTPLPEKTCLYTIYREQYYDTVKYYIRVQHGDRRMMEFGRFNNPDGSINNAYFINGNINYLEALFNLRHRPKTETAVQPEKTKKESAKKSPKSKQAQLAQEQAEKNKLILENLQNQNPIPDLESFKAWDQTHIEVLLYLNQVLHKIK